MNRRAGIYRIVHVETDREYIGQAQDIRQRWCVHRWALNNGRHHGSYLQRTWRKYGPDAFAFEILAECDAEELTALEQRYLDERRPIFNTCPAAGSPRGRKMPPRSSETRAKLSAALQGRRPSDETMAKALAANKGRALTDEHREKISAGGRGLRRSHETRAKIAAARRGKKLSSDHVAKAVAGRRASMERRKAVRQENLG